VHVNNLYFDFYEFDPVRHCLVGEMSGQTFKMGDAVVVRVAKVDIDARRIDFDLIPPRGKKKGGNGKSAKSSFSKTDPSKKTPPKTPPNKPTLTPAERAEKKKRKTERKKVKAEETTRKKAFQKARKKSRKRAKANAKPKSNPDKA